MNGREERNESKGGMRMGRGTNGKKGTKWEWENKVNEKGWNGNGNERENMNDKQNGMRSKDRMGMRT